MSGDVQPRKRKDKKRKKDDLAEPEPPIIPAAAPVAHVQHDADDFNIIHVHSDHGTGGGICAKLIFFILLFVLAGLTGLIVYQNQGVENYDTPIAESRFANIFEGWTDEPAHDHDSHDDHAALDAVDDHEEEHDEAPDDHDAAHDEDEHDEDAHDEEHDEEHEESETQLSEEPADEEDEPNISEPDANDDDQNESQAADDEDDDHVSDELDNELENDVIDENTSQNDDDNASQNDDDNASQNDDDNTSQNDDDNISQNDDDNVSQNNDDNVSQNDNDDDNTSQNDDDADDDLKVESQEVDDQNDDDDDDEVEARNEDISSENEIFEEESVETNAELNVIDEPEEEEIVDNTQGEDELVKQSEEIEPEVEEPRSDVAVKIGVGVALAVVAYTVLVKKWKSGKPDKIQDEDMYIDLSRRNTITCDPTLENFETDSNDIEDEYSEEEDDEEEEEEEEEDEEIEDIIMKKINYEQIQSSYSRLLPPEKDTLIIGAKVDDYEDEDQEEQNVEYDDEEGEEYEEEVQEDNEHGDEEHEEYQEEDEEEDEEERDEEQEEISDVDDEDLMKKLEAKYGKLQDSKGEEEEDEEDEDEDDYYAFKRTANPKQDKKDETDRQMKFAEANLQNNAELALKLYTNLLVTLPNNIQIKYGHALALDNLADSQRSNKLLQDAIQSYEELLQTAAVPDDMFLQVGDRCINRLRFRGYYDKAVQIHKQLISRFPKEPNHRNQLAVTLLTANRLSEAKQVLRELLLRWPNDGFAKVNYGFILKTRDNNLTGAIEYLKSGIESKAEGVVDGRFYFHLGDALTRLRRNDEAQQIFEDGVNHNVFLSKYQRSLYNVERLTARPWWYAHQTPYQLFFNLLEEKWQQIRDEGLALLSKTGFFKDEAENLKDTGQWKQFELFARGQKMAKNCQKCPETCKIVETCPDAWNCRRGQIKFSVMHPGTHVWPHCGPSNCRLRSHLGLKVPPNTFIRVADKIRSWSEGKVFIFDDSFEHEVWHNGSDIRLVLIVDVWHPELTNREKHLLPAI